MSTTKISPPYDELQSLSQPLTKGEWKFLEWLKKNLTSDWEIYIQPFMNGLRPDFVLLSPQKGIAVYKKDWDLSAVQYSYEGEPPELFGMAAGKKFQMGAAQDPVRKIQLGFYPISADGLVKAENFRSCLATLRRIRGLWKRSM